MGDIVILTMLAPDSEVIARFDTWKDSDAESEVVGSLALVFGFLVLLIHDGRCISVECRSGLIATCQEDKDTAYSTS